MSGPQDTFVNGLCSCVNPTFTFPSITSPGLTNFSLGCFEANFAGVSYVSSFLPPDPHNLPAIPDISLFLNPAMASFDLPTDYPAFSLSLGGVDISIPQAGTGVAPYDVSAEFKLIAVSVAGAFLVLKQFITDIINNLSVNLPTVSFVSGVIDGLLIEVDLSSPSVPVFSGCLSTAIVNLFSELV